MTTFLRKFSSLLAGFYTWIAAVFLGMIALDVLYARSLGVDQTPSLFSAVSDFLLFIGLLAVLAALAAVLFTWKTGAPRNLFIASLLVLLLEFAAEPLLAAFLPDLLPREAGPWLRIGISALASVLALAGFHQLVRPAWE